MNLVNIKNDDVVMTLKEITDLLEVRHNDAMNVVAKMVENEDFGLATKISYPIISGKGRTQEIETYQLNKRQSIAVAARLNTSLLMRVIDKVDELEKQLNNIKSGWLKARIEGKVSRRVETDTIKEFVEYATKQGSSNAKFYYSLLTKGTYKALYILEKGANVKDMRERLNVLQLQQLAVAENLLQRTIGILMQEDVPYKDIYKLALAELDRLVAVLGKQLPGEDNVLKISKEG